MRASLSIGLPGTSTTETEEGPGRDAGASSGLVVIEEEGWSRGLEEAPAPYRPSAYWTQVKLATSSASPAL